MREYDKVDTALRTLNDAIVRDKISKGDSEALNTYIEKQNVVKYESQRETFENMLKNSWQYNPVILRIAAKHKEAAVRRSVLAVIRDYPTASNREILERLLNDSDEGVRNAAKQVAAELEEIKNMPFNELVSEPKGI